MAGLWETAAFTLRTLGARNGRVLLYYILSSILFVLAPLWINAYVYMVGARVACSTLPDQRVLTIPAAWMTKLFVSADVVRVIFRLIELGSDSHNEELITKEMYTIGMDAIPMIVALTLLNVAHPGRFLSDPGDALTSTEDVEMVGRRKRYGP
ncbi:hypothetical protein VTI74DRAFT_4971 [Chaetomium olivicolor]